MRVEDNTLGIQGPVYAISDGVSTKQSGKPFEAGKYCVSGTFSGAEADWGAGIAFDLNHPPGGATKAAYEPAGKVDGFRIALGGSSPGPVRVQFILDEPQAGNQPLLIGRLGSTTDYRIDWAQVPTSWEVDDAGREVENSIYSVQIYLDGSVAGDFDVCVEDFLPLTAAELGSDALPPAAGYTGARTIDAGMLAAEYARWKARHLEDCGDGTACVPRDEGDCISEGVAYGMLLAANNGDQASFDKLWAYFEKHKNANGVMKWQTSACGAATAEGSATDGELDAAMALIQASCLWGATYEADARELIAASRTPWRVATDYAWFNEPRAVTFLDGLSTYVDANGGVARLFEPNSNFRGGLAMSALQSSGAKAQEYTDAWLTTAVDDDTYFPGTLRPLYMLLLAHQFPKSCN